MSSKNAMIPGPGLYKTRTQGTVEIGEVVDNEARAKWYPLSIWNAETGLHNHSGFDIVAKVEEPK